MALNPMPEADDKPASALNKSIPEQRKQQKQQLTQKKATMATAAPTPWKKGVAPQRQQQTLGTKPGVPGPDVSKKRIQESSRNRDRQMQDRQPEGPGQQGQEKRPSRARELFDLLFGDTEFGQKVEKYRQNIQKLQRAMSLIFNRDRKPRQEFNPGMEQQKAQFARNIEQNRTNQFSKKLEQQLSKGPAGPQKQKVVEQKPGGLAPGSSADKQKQLKIGQHRLDPSKAADAVPKKEQPQKKLEQTNKPAIGKDKAAAALQQGQQKKNTFKKQGPSLTDSL